MRFILAGITVVDSLFCSAAAFGVTVERRCDTLKTSANRQASPAVVLEVP